MGERTSTVSERKERQFIKFRRERDRMKTKKLKERHGEKKRASG
jgi:hypothetical protein